MGGAEMEEYVVGPERRGDAACRVGGGGGRGPGWQCWRGAVVVGRGEQSDCAVVLQREESYFQVVGAFSRLQVRRKPDSGPESDGGHASRSSSACRVLVVCYLGNKERKRDEATARGGR